MEETTENVPDASDSHSEGVGVTNDVFGAQSGGGDAGKSSQTDNCDINMDGSELSKPPNDIPVALVDPEEDHQILLPDTKEEHLNSDSVMESTPVCSDAKKPQSNNVHSKNDSGFDMTLASDAGTPDCSVVAGDSAVEVSQTASTADAASPEMFPDFSPLSSLPSVASQDTRSEENQTPMPDGEVSRDSSVDVRDAMVTEPDDSDDDSDDVHRYDLENDTVSHSSSDSDSESDGMETETSPVTDTWCSLKEIYKREYTGSNRLPQASMFRNVAGGSVRLVQRLKKYTTLDYHEGCVNALHFNKTGNLLSSGSDDLNIVVWDWIRSKQAFHFDSGHRGNVFQCKFLPLAGDCHMVSCARDGQVRLAELSSMAECKSTRKLAQHKGAAHKLALLEDSSHVFYSCGEDGTMFEIDLRQEKPTKLGVTKEGSTKVALYSIHSNPHRSEEFCVGGRDHLVRIYDARMMSNSNDEDRPVKRYRPHHLTSSDIKANVTCAVYNYNGSEVLASYNDEDIYLFDTSHSDGADSVHRYVGHRNNATVKGVNFYGPKSEFVVSGSDCGNIFLWQKTTEQIVQFFHGDDGGVVNVLEPHPHDPVLATSGLDHDVKVWMPLRADANKLDRLKQVVRRNRKEREEERSHEPDMDSQIFWFLMHNLRRQARRRARDDGEEISSSSESNTDSDDSASRNPAASCTQS